MITLDESIAEIDLNPLKEYLLGGFHWNRDCTPDDDFANMNQEPGLVPYKLYAHLSKNFKRVADLGTYYGHSALACSLRVTVPSTVNLVFGLVVPIPTLSFAASTETVPPSTSKSFSLSFPDPNPIIQLLN
mgnify:CR=1 FL=1